MIMVAVGFAADRLGRRGKSGRLAFMGMVVLFGFFSCCGCCRCGSCGGSGGAVYGTGAIVVITGSFATDGFGGRGKRRGRSLLVLSRGSRSSRRYTRCSWSIAVPGRRPLACVLETYATILLWMRRGPTSGHHGARSRRMLWG